MNGKHSHAIGYPLDEGEHSHPRPYYASSTHHYHGPDPLAVMAFFLALLALVRTYWH